MSVYKNRAFARFQRKARLTDADLLKAIEAAERGLIDADLGGGVIKQRIARSGEGKSGGSRTIILFRRGKRAVYIYGYEKKDQDNIEASELDRLKKLAEAILGYTEPELKKRVDDGALIKVKRPEKESHGEKVP